MISFFQSVFFLLLPLITAEANLANYSSHKFYLSVSKLNYSEKEQAFQMISRVFIDDLELALNTRYGVVLQLDTENEQKELAKTSIQRYLASRLELKVNSQKVDLEFIGYTYEADQILLLTAFKPGDLPQKAAVEFRNRLLTDVFEEQQNLVHLSMPGYKKSRVLSRESDTFKWDLSLP